MQQKNAYRFSPGENGQENMLALMATDFSCKGREMEKIRAYFKKEKGEQPAVQTPSVICLWEILPNSWGTPVPSNRQFRCNAPTNFSCSGA